MKYCQITWTEAWDMPISMRRWWIERYKKENERIAKQQKSAKR